MSDGDKAHKLVLLKAEVPEQVAAELDQKAKELGYSTRAKLIRHIIGRFLRPEVSFDEFEDIHPPTRMDPGPGRSADLSPELQATLQTLNKSLDLTAAQTSIIARQNETIHRLVGQNEQLTQVLTAGNDHPALPELSRSTQEQTQTPPEVAEERTEPEPVTQGTGPTQTETVPEHKTRACNARFWRCRTGPTQTETVPEHGLDPVFRSGEISGTGPTQTETVPEQPKDKQPLPVGDVLEVPQAVELGKSMGVQYSKDTVRRAVDYGVLVAVPDTHPLKVYAADVRAFAVEYDKVGKLPKMPKIRDGKVI